MNSTRRLSRLKALFRLVEDEDGWELDVNNFDDRVKMQKLVYLAGYFGFDHEYSYNMYLHGPYSPDLAKDYYDSALETVEPDPDVVGEMDRESFMATISAKSVSWLEVAATIKSIHDSYSTVWSGDELRNRVNSNVADKKNEEESFVDRVYSELLEASVIT